MMQRGLVDLEELVIRCKDAQSRTYIDEAVASYTVGAYRACIIATWLAVYFDLASKFKSLAISGDSVAQAWIANLERHLGNYHPDQPETASPLLKIERSILNHASATDIELISRLELSDLKRLRTDRNRCAHPTMRNEEDRFTPSAELARAHLRNAIEYVLSKPALQGKRAVDRLMSYVDDEGFPISVEDATNALKGEDLLDGLSDRALFSMIDKLLTKLLDSAVYSIEHQRKLAALAGIRISLAARFDEPFRSVLKSVLSESGAEHSKNVVAFFRHAPWAWSHLDLVSENKVKLLISPDSLSRNGVGVIVDALRVSGLRDTALQSMQTLDIDKLLSAIPGLPPSDLLDESVRRLSESASFDATKSLIRKVFRPYVEQMEQRHIAGVIAAYQANDQVGRVDIVKSFFEIILRQCPKDALGSEALWRAIQPDDPWGDDDKRPIITALVDRRFLDSGDTSSE